MPRFVFFRAFVGPTPPPVVPVEPAAAILAAPRPTATAPSVGPSASIPPPTTRPIAYSWSIECHLERDGGLEREAERRGLGRGLSRGAALPRAGDLRALALEFEGLLSDRLRLALVRAGELLILLVEHLVLDLRALDGRLAAQDDLDLAAEALDLASLR